MVEQIALLEAAIAEQDALRPALGDAAVDPVISARRAQIAQLQSREPDATDGEPGGAVGSAALEQLRARIPPELADKARIIGAAAQRGAERRTVTVLFADLSGFTALSERTDPEIIQAFQGDLFDELSTVVYEYEGFVEKFVGDAIVAIFGAPLSHEDDPERALRAALAIRDRMEVLNRRWSEELGESLTLHIGLNTGPVVAGQIGSDVAGGYAVTGDTINTASRLQAAAAPGQILVSQSTYRPVHEAFVFRRLEPIQVKGKREPLSIFELVRARLHPGKSRGIEGLTAPMVGRDPELRQLRQVSDRLLRGEGAIVLITGDAGIGKSRLVSEWRTTLGGRVRWLEGRSFPGASATPYDPFLEMLRRYAGIAEEDSESTARERLATALRMLFQGEPDAGAIVAGMLGMRPTPDEAAVLAELTPRALAQRLVALVEGLFTRLATERPTILVIEDVHWTDDSSLELLERLLPLTASVPLAIVAVSRPTEAPFLRMVATEHADRLTRVELHALEAEASATLVRELLATPEAPEAARTLILEKAEGNPFFVEEVIRSLTERGALVRDPDGGRWTTTALLDRVSVPDTLHGVLMARLDRLPDEPRRLAQQAAVIGRTFLYRVLLWLAEADVALETDLSELEREALIRELRSDPELEYIFRHALIHDVAYESLLARERRHLHARVGEAIEKLFPDRVGEFHAVLGRHFLLGEVWEPAFEHFVSAGDAATRLHAHSEARQQYARALEALAKMPRSEENRRRLVDVTINLVAVSWGAEDPERNLARLTEVEAVARELAGPDGSPGADMIRLARVQYWLGRIHYYRDEPREAIPYFKQVLAVAQQLGDEQLLGFPSALMGRALLMQGHFDQAARLLSLAAGPLEKSEDWLEWSYTVAFLGVSLAIGGQVARGRDESARALARARETGNAAAIAGCLPVVGFQSYLARDAESFYQAAREATAEARRAESPLLAHIGLVFEAWSLSMLGRHAEAAGQMAEAQAVAKTLGGRLFMADWAAAATAELAHNAGEREQAIGQAQQAVEFARSIGGIFGEALAHRVWGVALASLPEPNHAESDAHLSSSIELFESGGALLEAAHTHLLWGQLSQERGDGVAATDHLRRAAPVFEEAGLTAQLDLARTMLDAVAVEEKR